MDLMHATGITGELEVLPISGGLACIALFDLDSVAISDTTGNPLSSEWLTGDERERASAFIDPLHRSRFIASRHFLRSWISRHAGIPPEAIRFRRSSNGKPRIEGSSLAFNLSRSGPFMAVGVASGHSIGVDIETNPDSQTCHEIAPRIFTSREFHHWIGLHPEDRPACFLKIWTIKEAVLKAAGEGLLREMREIELDLTMDPPAILRFPPAYGDASEWTCACLRPPIPRCFLSYALCPTAYD